MKKKIFKFASLFLLIILCCPLFLTSCGQASAAKNLYQIKATYDDKEKSLSCEQSVTYVNNSDNILEEICFFLYANAYNEGTKTISAAYKDKAYPNGESFGGIKFESLKIGDEDAEYFLSEDKCILTVDLNEDLYPDECAHIDMTYCISLANINHRLGFGDNAVNFGNFFPIACVYEDGFVKNKFTSNGDPFYSDVSDFEVDISCNDKYVVAATGDKSEYISNGQKVATCKAKNVRDFCFVLSEKFEVLSQEVDGVLVNYYFYDDQNPEKYLQTAIKALLTFEKFFGDYPYRQLSVVKTNFCFGGMEYSNLVMINDQIADVEMYNYVIVHEIAHQWWYGMVGNNEYADSWVDEGLTEFSTALFFENNEEYGIEYDTIMANAVGTYKNFVKIFEKINGTVDESMNRDLSEFSTEPEYVNIAYTKGMLLFDALRNSMSDRKFFRCLQNYLKEFKFKNSSPEKLIDSFSKSAHTNLSKFFKAWIDGSVVIE